MHFVSRVNLFLRIYRYLYWKGRHKYLLRQMLLCSVHADKRVRTSYTTITLHYNYLVNILYSIDPFSPVPHLQE